jgi:DNA-binding SARP family transcriptional activator
MTAALRVFGTPRLERPDGTLYASLQPKRLAVLIYLVVNGRKVSRDALTGLFWPEQSEPQARNSLNQVVHGLRVVLSPDAVVSEAGTLSVPPDVVTCDARRVSDHLAEGEWEAALSLYEAPLLDGFYLQGAPEFERWVAETRATFTERVLGGAWSLAEEALAKGDGAAAGGAAQKGSGIAKSPN